MRRIPQLLVLETLGKEGEVTLWRAKPSDPYRVLFRLDGRKFNRSTGEKDREAATRKGAEIFAEVVRGPKEAVTIARLEKKIEDLTDIVLQLAAKGFGNQPKGEIKTLGEARDGFFAAKTEERVSASTYERLKRRIDAFVDYVGADVRLLEVTVDIIAKWVQGRPGNMPRSIKNDVDTVSQFYRWCGAPPRRWCDSDIPKGVSRPRVARHSTLIEILTIEQARQLMELVERNHPEYVLFYAIALFGGVRANKKSSAADASSGEILRLFEAVKANGQWPAKLWNGLVLHIPSGKVNGAPRQVHTPENLKAWLAAYPASLEVPHRCWHTKHIAKPLALPKNGLRHTACSVFISAGGDFGRAAVLFGNSEAMLKARYVNLMSKETAEEYGKILPHWTSETRPRELAAA